MDRRRPRAAALGLVLAAGLGLAAGAAVNVEPPIRALRWLAPDADPVAALGTTPPECLVLPRDPEAALSVEVGRAAFRTPVLLGGQAARSGLACESCHRGGHDNPHFLFPGVSGAPGTADVTSSLFSSHRGDGIDDPRPIPDLGGPKARLKVPQAPGDPALPAFIHGLVTEEFDGPEPPAAVLAGLAAYVRALDPAACAGRGPEPLGVRPLFSDARRALTAAQALAARGDRPAAVLMVAGARARLGLIDERYAAPGLAALRARLRAADRELAAIAEALRESRPRAGADIARWLAAARPLEADLARRERDSLFDSRHLRVAAGRRLPP